MFSLTARITTPLYYETLGWVGHSEALPTIPPLRLSKKQKFILFFKVLLLGCICIYASTCVNHKKGGGIKMSRFTHKFREKFKDLRKRHWGKNRHKFGKCAPLVQCCVYSNHV